MSKKNLMQITSYYDLSVNERAEVVIALSKPKNFFNTFFNHLPHARTMVECFNKLNDLHQDIYGETLYSNYNSFNIVYTRYLKEKKK